MKTAVPTLKHNRKSGFLEVDVAVAPVIIALAILPQCQLRVYAGTEDDSRGLFARGGE